MLNPRCNNRNSKTAIFEGVPKPMEVLRMHPPLFLLMRTVARGPLRHGISPAFRGFRVEGLGLGSRGLGVWGLRA